MDSEIGVIALIIYNLPWSDPSFFPDMQLSSTAFSQGGAIPARYTGEGEDVSPELSWP